MQLFRDAAQFMFVSVVDGLCDGVYDVHDVDCVSVVVVVVFVNYTLSSRNTQLLMLIMRVLKDVERVACWSAGRDRTKQRLMSVMT